MPEDLFPMSTEGIEPQSFLFFPHNFLTGWQFRPAPTEAINMQGKGSLKCFSQTCSTSAQVNLTEEGVTTSRGHSFW